MTPDEVMVLPGGELNRLAAEKVMGWTLLPGGHVSVCDFPPTSQWSVSSPWHPCDFWDHAMMLNEQMREDKKLFGRYEYSISNLAELRLDAASWYDVCEQPLMFIEPLDITRAAVLTAMEET